MNKYSVKHLPQTQNNHADRLFSTLVQSTGLSIIALIVSVGIFLLLRAIPAVSHNQENFFTYSGNWMTTEISNMHFGIAAIAQVTIFISVLALIFATPLALGVALYLTCYAPYRIDKVLAYLVDLLAGIPSIIYGIWGLYVLAPHLRTPALWINIHCGTIFLFRTGNVSIAGGGTIFTGAIVLAVMILPIITAITREVLAQTPREHIEAALALGAIRWEVIKLAVLPFGRFTYISAAMLGLSRACGETVALLIILRVSQYPFTWSVFDGGATFTTKIAAAAAEFDDQHNAGAYIAAGLTLFIFTVIMNTIARAAISRRIHQ